MADNKAFHNPTDFGKFDIGSTQVNKQIQFNTSIAVITGCIVALTIGRKLIKTYAVGSGLVISNNDMTVTLTISGSELIDYVGKVLKGHCSFFVAGDTELTFDLEIKETYV